MVKQITVCDCCNREVDGSFNISYKSSITGANKRMDLCFECSELWIRFLDSSGETKAKVMELLREDRACESENK